MAKRKQEPATEPAAGFQAAPADGGLSIDRLAQAFAAMMGTEDPYAAPPAEVVHVDASPDLDEEAGTADEACRVNPASILEALLFVGLPGGVPISSRTVAGLMRGVRPQEIDELAADLRHRYEADGCPYEVASEEAGWVMRLRPEFARFGSVLESRARLVRLDAEALDVLALVAWNQPVARDQLVELGCDARPATLRQLVRRGLLELRHDGGGDPAYRTTPKFLEVFKLESLADLPRPTDPPA
ncbi:MAG: SMC-Scp complex subunit ScpB [Planctomycetia bacterium]